MTSNIKLESANNFGVFLKTFLLFGLAENCKAKKDIFLKNTIAKTASLLGSISILYEREKYYDGWILYRALTDRLAHIFFIEEHDSYEEFEKWTYIRDFEDNNKARSDPRFRKVLLDPNFKFDEKQLSRYNQYKKEKPVWQRPDVEAVFKKEGLDFIYKFGYDYASKHTHPMYNDGNYEFYALTGLEPNPYKDTDHLVLIKNSLLLATLITQTCLNFMTLNFRTIVYDYIESIRLTIENEDDSYKINFRKITKLIEQGIRLCE